MPSARPDAAAVDGMRHMVPPCPSARRGAIEHGAEALFRASILPGRLPVTMSLIDMSQIVQDADFHRDELLIFAPHGAAQCGTGASNTHLRRPRSRPWATPRPSCCGSGGAALEATSRLCAPSL